MIFKKWADVDFHPTQNLEPITEVVCYVCGGKEDVTSIIGRDLHLGQRLDAVQKNAEYYREINAVWKSILNAELDLFEAFYSIAKISRRHEKENVHGQAMSPISGTAEITCKKCGADVKFSYDIRTKNESELPKDIPISVLRNLKPPAIEVLGKMLSRKDQPPIAGTIDGIFKMIDTERFKAAETVVTKVRELCSELNWEFRGEFETFLLEFSQWIQKRKDEDFAKYLRAVDGFAKYVVALEETSTGELTILERIKEKLKPNQAAVMFAEDAKPGR